MENLRLQQLLGLWGWCLTGLQCVSESWRSRLWCRWRSEPASESEGEQAKSEGFLLPCLYRLPAEGMAHVWGGLELTLFLPQPPRSCYCRCAPPYLTYFLHHHTPGLLSTLLHQVSGTINQWSIIRMSFKYGSLTYTSVCLELLVTVVTPPSFSWKKSREKMFSTYSIHVCLSHLYIWTWKQHFMPFY